MKIFPNLFVVYVLKNVGVLSYQAGPRGGQCVGGTEEFRAAGYVGRGRGSTLWTGGQVETDTSLSVA